jgi:hypothetical protein
MVSIHCPPGYEPGACVMLMIIPEITWWNFDLRFRCATQLSEQIMFDDVRVN